MLVGPQVKINDVATIHTEAYGPHITPVVPITYELPRGQQRWPCMPSASSLTTTPCTTTHHTMLHKGLNREFWIHRPCCTAEGVGQASIPLVIMLHGWGEHGSEYAGVTSDSGWRHGADRWAEESERSCFMVAWPQGLETRLGNLGLQSSWNAGGCSVADANLCDFEIVSSLYEGSLCSADSCNGVCQPCSWCSCADDVGFISILV